MAHATRKYCFPIYSFQEIVSMTPVEWEEECRLNGCDMTPHPEDEVVEEIIELHRRRVKK